MILVTGATGFLGSEVCKQLLSMGESIRGLKRSSSIIPSMLINEPNITWVTGTIELEEDLRRVLEGVTQLYHCAALVSFHPADRDRLFAVNATATEKIVAICLEKNIRLVHVSSVATLGDAVDGELIDENSFPEPTAVTHAYGMSKIAGEQAVWAGIKKGLSGVIVNPSVIIGAAAGETGSGAIFKLVRNGMAFYTSGVSGFVDVRDVASRMIVLMNTAISGERYIISAENVSYKDLFSAIAMGFDLKPPRMEAKAWMLSIAWRMAKLVSVFSKQPLGLTKDTAASSLNRSYYSHDKLGVIGREEYIPISTSIREITAALTKAL